MHREEFMGQFRLRNCARAASTLLACTLASLCASQSSAQTLDIAQTPLASASNLSVLPNLLFILDDSGSMMFDALPDHTERVQGGAERRYWHENYNCKPKGVPTQSSNKQELDGRLPNHCERTDPPFGAAEYNGMYYNPQFTYRPPLNPDGTSYPSQTSWNAVTCDPFSSKWKCKDWYSVGQGYYDSATTTVQVDSRGRQSYTNKYTKQWYGSGDTFDVQKQWPEIVYCLNADSDVNNSTVCKRNGSDGTPNPFRYTDVLSGAAGGGYPDATYNYPKLRRGAPHYYTIEPVDYCRDAALVFCQSTKDDAYNIPAPVRFCHSRSDAYLLATPTGDDPTSGGPRCRKKYEEATGYIYPRYGRFKRVDIVANAVFTDRPLRTDCKSRPTCSYGEEMTNFANWFAYYRTRMLMMKTATGVAFSPIDARYRVGFVTINPENPVRNDRYLKVDMFTPEQKKAWYETLYQQAPRGGTPLPQALSRAGRYFAAVKDGINRGMDDDPMQFSCQQNFALLTTDGYWSGRGGVDENGKAIGNVDNDPSSAPRPAYDGGKPFNPAPDDPEFSSSGTLADVALYYYRTDLRRGGGTGDAGADVSENNVPTSEKDNANWQHMVTFGLGMAEGLMDWRPDYESRDATGDFDNVRRGASGRCSWAPGATCNWPMPGSRSPSNLDDLWHAAVNGRGQFFYARDTQAVQDGLNTALTNLNERNAAGASAATSTPNVTPSDRAIFLSSYTTIQWYGDVQARFINPNDGSVLPDVAWSARDQLQGLVGKSEDKRNVYLADYDQDDNIKPFLFDKLTTAEKTWFSNKCDPVSNMTQCALLDPDTDRVTANSGQNMVAFLRGQSQHEAKIYRDRQFVLGDTVNAVPLYVARPRFAFGDRVRLPYLTWRDRSDIRGRTPALYVGANDGQLHAFDVNTGVELWSFIPRQLAPGLWKLAEQSYANKHKYYVDGSPTSMDVWDGATWRTIVVGGLNAGGRGYFALDVTNPNAPRALWEFCSDSRLCPVADEDLGYSFGNPIVTKRASDGRWVALVTSGYNNVSPGDGKGYLYVLDALTGAVLEKIDTDAGNERNPIGLGRIAAWADNFFVDNTTKWVYGGDQQGNIWRFDLTVSPAKVIKLAQALDENGIGQPITTKPELGLVDGIHRVVFIGTGRYLGVEDLTDPATQKPAGTWAWQQSVYAFKDLEQPMGSLRDPGNQLVQQTIIELSSGTQRTVSNNKVTWGTQNGWYVDLDPAGGAPGERVTVDPQLALGTLLVTTNVPGASACAVGGDSWVYQFDYRSGVYVLGSPNNIVARRQTGALTAGLVVYQLQKGSLVGQVQRSETTTRREDIVTAPAPLKSRRTSWREVTPGIE
jgi:type IV pilus assembly protein PilY1